MESCNIKKNRALPELETLLPALLDGLDRRYRPIAVILYGSWARGEQRPDSDLDVLIVVDGPAPRHDGTSLSGIPLDLWIYDRAGAEALQPQDCLQIYDGRILRDKDGLARRLLERVRDYVSAHQTVSREEKELLRGWCAKMLRRQAQRGAEGLYRGCWLLTDSLEIYCQLRDRFYFGPKKTIRLLEEEDPEGYARFLAALENREPAALERWTGYVTAAPPAEQQS